MEKICGRSKEESKRIKERQNLAVKLYQEGVDLEEIASATGYKEASIIELMKKLWIREKRKDPVIIYWAQDRRRLRKVEADGKNYTDIIDFIGGR